MLAVYVMRKRVWCLHAARLGVCPASTDKRLHGVHGGRNAVRSYWIIADLLKREDFGCAPGAGGEYCAKCDFYDAVKSEEGKYIWPNAFLLRLLKREKKRSKAL